MAVTADAIESFEKHFSSQILCVISAAHAKVNIIEDLIDITLVQEPKSVRIGTRFVDQNFFFCQFFFFSSGMV